MFQPFKSILKKRLNQYSFKNEISATQIFSFWQDSIKRKFGEETSKKTQAVRFRGGILTVKAESSALLQELRLQEPKIVGEINNLLREKNLDSQRIKRVIYKIGA